MMDGQVDICTYCGALANDRDHVIPAAYEGVRVFTPSNWVWACRECNAILQDNMFVTVEERAAYLAEQLERRHRRLLKMGRWYPNELDELGPRMRAAVIRDLKMKQIVADRIANCRAVSRRNG